jgi:hypothetical protein
MVAAGALAVGILMSPLASGTSHAAALGGSVTGAESTGRYTKILVSDDGKVVMVCHYTASGRLLYCNIKSPK